MIQPGQWKHRQADGSIHAIVENTEGRGLLDRELVRRELEHCDTMPDIFRAGCMYGGTGSALASMMRANYSSEYSGVALLGKATTISLSLVTPATPHALGP